MNRRPGDLREHHGGYHSDLTRTPIWCGGGLLSTITRMGWGQSPAGRLLDRAAELGVIAAALDSACSGSGSTLLVEGTAGIGKTSLLTHACEQAARAGMTVLAARAGGVGGGYGGGGGR